MQCNAKGLRTKEQKYDNDKQCCSERPTGCPPIEGPALVQDTRPPLKIQIEDPFLFCKRGLVLGKN